MLKDYAHQALEPARLRALIHLVEHNLGYALYREVEAAKIDLSAQERTNLAFADGPIVVTAPLHRDDFEAWLDAPLAAIRAGVDHLLRETGATVADIDRVFLTGGSARVPRVRRLFDDRFGADRVSSGDHLTSVASGLALAAAG